LVLILPNKLEIKFEKEIIEQYIKSKGMVTKKSDRFAKQLCIAMYGETLEEKIKKENIIEKTLIVQNLLRISKLSTNQIADAVNENLDFVTKVKDNLKII